MRQFAEQVRQVGILYATQIRGWIWSLAFILLVVVLLGLFISDGNGYSVISYAYFCAIFLGTGIVDQLKQQFAHPRARLLPEFNLAHLAVPLGIIFAGSVGLPAIAATIRQTSPLPYAAASSIAMSVFLLVRLHPRLGWLVAFIFILAIWLPRDSGLDIDFTSLLLRPALSIPLIFLGWLGIGFYFFKLCHLAEDDDSYQQFNDETRKVAADGAEGETRAKYRNAARWWAISDRWQTKIGGFHQFRTFRIIRLLCYGFGATPVEVAAIGYAILMTVVVGLIVINSDDPYDITRSTDAIFLVVPALFASMAPIAVAGSAITLRVPRLKNEILFPLTRRQLIDNLLLASAWHSTLIWLLGCASGMGVLLCALPDEARTISLFATAALLTGATAIAAYGLSLHIVMFEIKPVQFFTLGLFVFAFGTLMVTWWLSREDTGDAPYWIIAAMMCVAGVLMTRTARTAWLNLELG